jgi:hypothetical protein
MDSHSVPHSPKLTKRGLLCMAQLNEWERQNVPFIYTPTGRDLYLTLAHQAASQNEGEEKPLKTMVVCQTDRAMRNRIREFERLELVEVLQSPTDARARVLHPTEKLLNTFLKHTEMLCEIFGQQFHIIRKEDA